MRRTAAQPTEVQVERVRRITAWYLDLYHGGPEDLGTAGMFCDPGRVGAFAVAPAALATGEPEALYRVLVATTMFQRLRDRNVQTILKGISAKEAEELCSPSRLLALADASGCAKLRTVEALCGGCDLGKDPLSKRGYCSFAPELACAPKQHTTILRRYGHFGKLPSSLALMLRAEEVADLRELREKVLKKAGSREEAAAMLEVALCRAWRVSDKIAAMFLSMVSNPDLTPGLAPWEEGLAWEGLVVVDQNVDELLTAVGYPGPWTYGARRDFVIAIARQIDLAALKKGLRSFNPRIVQQAMYLFTSSANRRVLAGDCWREGRCGECRWGLREGCGVAAV